jgi:hypothetical protein
MSERYGQIAHLFPAPESLYTFWEDIEPYLPERWRHLYLLSDATLGAFTSIINRKKVGSNLIYVNDTAKEIIQLLRVIRSNEYREIIFNIKVLIGVNSKHLIKQLRTTEIPKSGPSNAKQAAVMMFAWLLTKRKWIHYDNMNDKRGIVVRKEDLIDLSDNEILKNVEHDISVLHDALTKVQLSCMKSYEFLSRNRTLERNDLLIFDPGPMHLGCNEDAFYKLRNFASYFFYHNSVISVNSLSRELIAIIRTGARFLIIIRNTPLIKRAFKEIIRLSELKININEITVTTYHIVTYDESGTRGIGHKEYLNLPCDYLVVRNYD